MRSPCVPALQIWILEKNGGSLVGGAIKLFQDRKNNPPAPRDPRLPPKPKGQTVGSFNKGLRVLTDAIGAKLQGEQQEQQQQH
jgi:oxygen-dependent protoporphyrinogen oxidase